MDGYKSRIIKRRTGYIAANQAIPIEQAKEKRQIRLDYTAIQIYLSLYLYNQPMTSIRICIIQLGSQLASYFHPTLVKKKFLNRTSEIFKGPALYQLNQTFSLSLKVSISFRNCCLFFWLTRGTNMMTKVTEVSHIARKLGFIAQHVGTSLPFS